MSPPFPLRWGRPEAERAHVNNLEKALKAGPNYPKECVGASDALFPVPDAVRNAGPWCVRRLVRVVGNGEDDYDAAKNAVESFKNFRVRWPFGFGGAFAAAGLRRNGRGTVRPPPAKPGNTYCVMAGLAGIWSIGPLRVLYKKEGPVQAGSSAAETMTPPRGWRPGKDRRRFKKNGKRFAVGSGCLSGHLLCGEERFEVTYDGDTGDVRYEVASFSRPAGPLGAAVYPVAWLLQGAFAHASCRAVEDAVRIEAAAAT
ncbi:unnamed protein product [Pedinophyceae sp. YPF-701]|nr:unnamed protein product [Pedinophyceae sp. YPF-701]